MGHICCVSKEGSEPIFDCTLACFSSTILLDESKQDWIRVKQAEKYRAPVYNFLYSIH